MRIGIIGAAAGLMLGIATPALAQDRTGFGAIAAGDFAKAERTLVAERRIYPQRPELMLNLAAVYHRTGRIADARALYGAALATPDVAMDLPDGTSASSHVLARAGMARLAQAVAAR